MEDFDSPWKEMISAYFRPFLSFFFPAVHAALNWGRPHEFLDKELQQILKESEVGRRVVDKLVKAWRNDGEEEWLLIHVEVQTQPESDFTERIFVYNYRLFDRYNRKVVSLAVLADDRPNWRPNTYGYEFCGFRIHMEFPTAKILDYATHGPEGLTQNPFPIVVQAHLKSLETRKDPGSRREAKLSLVKSLYEQDWTKDDIREIFRFIDWVMTLPEELAITFWDEYQQFEEIRHMPYVTSVERIGREKGKTEGLLAAIALGIDLRFPQVSADLLEKVRSLQNVADLEEAVSQLRHAPNEEHFVRWLHARLALTAPKSE